MITFQQLCELMTCNQRHSWFYFYKEHSISLTEEEKQTVHIEETGDRTMVRVWYPLSRWENRQVDSLELQRMLTHAIETENWNEIKKLKERMSKKI